MTNIVSTLQIRLIDDVSAAGRKVADVLQQDARRVTELQAALKQSGTSDKLQASLSKLGASKGHVEGVTRAWGDFVKQEGLAGKATADLTRDQIVAIRSWESVTKASVKAIIGEERSLTEATRREVLAREGAMRQEEAALRRKVEQEAALMKRLREQERHAQDRQGFRHYVAGSVAMAVSGHGVVSATEKVLEKGGELQHVRVGLENAGITPAEIVRIEDQALKLSARVGNESQTSIIELAKEVRSVMADPAEMSKVLEPITAAKSILDALDTTGQSSAGIGQLVKAGELLGAGQSPERMKELIDGWTRVMQVQGKTISPDQIYEFAKYSKAAGAQLSDRFLMTTGPSVVQELGGSTTGNDIAQMSRQLTSGFQNRHVALKEMARIGMVDPNAIDYLNTGEAKGLKPGTSKVVQGESLFHTDPDKWVYEVLMPHMEAAGMKDRESQLNFVQKTFTGTSDDFISKLITQRQSFDTHAGLYQMALGLKAVANNAKDATVGLNSLSIAIGNLSAQVSVPVMDTIGRGLNGMAGWINNLAEVAKAHPVAAPVLGATAAAGALGAAGWMSMKVWNGFGLGTAATELTASATALDAAAARLGATGVAGGAGAAAATGEAAAVTLGGIVARALPPVALTVAAIEAGKHDAWVKAETAKTINTPAGQAVPDLEKQSWRDWILGRAPKPAAPIATEDSATRAGLDKVLKPADPIVLPQSALAIGRAPFAMRPADADDRPQSRRDAVPPAPAARPPTATLDAEAYWLRKRRYLEDRGRAARETVLNPPNPIRMPARPYTPVPPSPTVDPMQFGARSTGVVPVSLVRDSSSGTLSAAVAQGTYAGFMRVLESRGAGASGDIESGGGIVKASFNGDDDVRSGLRHASLDGSDTSDQVRNAIVGTEHAVSDLRDIVKHNGMGAPTGIKPDDLDGGWGSGGPRNLRYGHGSSGGYRHTPDSGGAPSIRYGHSVGGGYRRPPAHVFDPSLSRKPMPKGEGGGASGSMKAVLFKGESGGNPGIYNYRSSGRYHVGHLDAEHTTIGDLARMQGEGKVFAAGKYQIIPKTMQGAIHALGLKVDDKFDSATQDRIYTDYLAGSKRPQIGGYVTGKSDNLDAAHKAMAQEWASVAYHGRGIYDGDGVNHASVSDQAAIHSLEQARATYQRLIKEGTDPTTARRSALLGIEHPTPRVSGMPVARASGVVKPKSDPLAATDPSLLVRKPRPTVTPTPHDITAMNASPAIDVSGIHEAIHHVRTLKSEMASLGDVGIDVQHRGFSGKRAGGAGSIRSALNNGFAADGRHWT